MAISKPTGKSRRIQDKNLKLPETLSFKYLGTEINAKGNVDPHIKQLKARMKPFISTL